MSEEDQVAAALAAEVHSFIGRIAEAKQAMRDWMVDCVEAGEDGAA